MCVAITLEPGSSLTKEEVERMNRSNSDGVGVAWAHGGAVSWFKTTKVEPAFIERLIHYWSNYPRLVHFRLATAGGTRSDLCHPFEVGPLASCQTQGSSGRVMIHNGHWNRWQEVHALLEAEDLLPDKGPWSDSRLAAYLAHTDTDWFQALGGRVATLDGDGTIHRLGDWQHLRQGIMVSNKIWDHSHHYKRGGYSGYRDWPGWEWGEEEWEQYFAESEEREKQDAIEKQKLADAEKAEEEAKRQRKAGHDGRPSTGQGYQDSRTQNGSSSSGRVSGYIAGGQPKAVGFRPASTIDAGDSEPGTDNDGKSAVRGNVLNHAGPGGKYVKQISEEPFWNAKQGKWYKYSNEAKAVVETTAPNSGRTTR